MTQLMSIWSDQQTLPNVDPNAKGGQNAQKGAQTPQQTNNTTQISRGTQFGAQGGAPSTLVGK